ncbi:MAG: hypothetical protein V1739_04290 [Candidatus Omnitrophota bacterium]
MKKRIFKNNIEFIIISYASNRYCVLICKEGNIVPKFPFENIEDAKNFIDTYK